MAAGADRGYIDWTPNAALWPLVDDILTVVNFYSDGGYPAPTVRDVYYDLLGRFGSTRGYQKGESFNRKVYRLLRKMRRSQMIGFDQVDDDSSNSLVVRTFVDPDGFWADVDGRVSTYQKDLTVSQPKRVKIFTSGKYQYSLPSRRLNVR